MIEVIACWYHVGRLQADAKILAVCMHCIDGLQSCNPNGAEFHQSQQKCRKDSTVSIKAVMELYKNYSRTTAAGEVEAVIVGLSIPVEPLQSRGHSRNGSTTSF